MQDESRRTAEQGGETSLPEPAVGAVAGGRSTGTRSNPGADDCSDDPSSRGEGGIA